jgi:hypothetical protein
MAHQNTPAERQILHLIEKLPLADDLKAGWIDQLRTGGMTEELDVEIRAKIAGDTDLNAPEKARYEVDLNRMMRQWRMEVGAKKFAR